MKLRFSNFASTVLAEDLTSEATSIIVDDSSSLPALDSGEVLRLTIYDGTQQPEIVEVLAIEDTLLTVTRGVEGTAAQAWSAGSRVRLAPTAEAFESLFSRLEVLYAGAAGGDGNDLTLTPEEPVTGYRNGQVFVCVTTAANDTSMSVRVSELEALPVVLPDLVTAVPAGHVLAGNVLMFMIYNTMAVLLLPVKLSGNVYATTLTVSGSASINDLVVTGAATVKAPADSDSSLRVPTTAWVRARILEYTSPDIGTFSNSISVPNTKAYKSFSSAAANVDLIKVNASDDTELGSAGDVVFGDVVLGADGYAYATTPSTGDDSTKLATTAFVNAALTSGIGGGFATLDSPDFTGTPTAPTASAGTNTGQIATTAFVTDAIATGVSPKANIASPNFTGSPTAPTQSSSDNSTKLATTAFVKSTALSKDVGATAVGSLCFACIPFTGSSITLSPGNTISGAYLHPAYITAVPPSTTGGPYLARVVFAQSTLSGTWRCLGGAVTTYDGYAATLFQRIS